ncbi:hypothetical protein ACHHYP_13212 [Achlya hypogyna]|uniref:Uncharacterized protein n=1 Tax=Achlya hypogyna TaxID=1202772 RepID=A0A1V9ZFU7_ACHHY|nr:hypothetical protein ACHHYP_13212 [Achlya hypogyna]
MDAIRAALAPAVQAVVAADAARAQTDARTTASYSYMFAACTHDTWTYDGGHGRVLEALLRRHHRHLLLRGHATATNAVQITDVVFVQGARQGQTLDVAELAPLPLRLCNGVEATPDSLVLKAIVDPNLGLVCEPTADAYPPDDSLLKTLWAPGCTFGGFAFPLGSFAPDTARPVAFNHGLARDPTRHNLYAFDGMLQTFQVPAVTSYIVRPLLYSDDALSYKTLSIQQMRMWAVDRRKHAATYRREGKTAEAIAEFSSAIEMDPDDVETYYERAMLYLQEKRSDMARVDLEKVLSLQPAHAMAADKLRALGERPLAAVAPPDPHRLLHLLEDEMKTKKDKKKKDHKKKDHKRRSKERKRRRSESPPSRRRRLSSMAARLNERNQRETDAFTALVTSYQQMMAQLQYVTSQNQKLHQLQVTAPPSPTRAVALKEEQLLQLQKKMYDMEATGKDMEKEMHVLREELTRQRVRAELAEQENEDFRRRIHDLEHQLLQKSTMIADLLLQEADTRAPPTRAEPLQASELPTDAAGSGQPSLLHGKSIRAHATEVNSVCFNGSGRVLFSASSDGTVRAWDAHSCQAKADYRGLGMSQPLICVRVSEDGELVLGAPLPPTAAQRCVGTGCDRICQVWRVGTGRIAHTLLGHKGKVYAAEFMLDRANEVLTGGADRSIRVWDVATGRNLKGFSCRSTCNDIAVAVGGQFASAHQDGAVRFWDARTKAPVHELGDVHSDQITSVSYAKDGVSLLTNSRDNSLKLLDARTYGVLGEYSAPGYVCGFNWSKASLTPNGAYIAAGSTSGAVLVWDARTQRLWREMKDTHTGAVVGCMWSPDGRKLASCDKNGCLVLWE